MFNIRGFEVVSPDHRKNPDKEIKLPIRTTSTSAGYDFFSPVTVVIKPNEKALIWTDVKSYMKNNEVLIIDVRSSIGIKKGLMLANILGIIDCDYYSNIDNDGNIGICLYNYSDSVQTIQEGERIAQGIFINYLIADNGNSDNERIGGIGSTK